MTFSKNSPGPPRKLQRAGRARCRADRRCIGADQAQQCPARREFDGPTQRAGLAVVDRDGGQVSVPPSEARVFVEGANVAV